MDKNTTEIIISAIDKTGDALKSVQNNLGQVGSQASAVKTALTGFAAAAGVSMFAGMINGAIEAAAGMHDLSQKTGASVEALSAMKGIAATSETSLETIGNGMAKMAKVMPDMADKTKDAAKALEAIGLEGDKVAKMKTDEAFQAIAKGMAGVNDSAGKTAVAMALFGKSGAELIPFLNDLGVAGELQAKITKEQAAQADNFGDNLTKLKISGESWKREIAMGMVPALSDLSDGLVTALSGAGGMREEVRRLSADHSIEEWTKSAIDNLLFLVDAVDGVKVAFSSAGSFLAMLGKNVETFAKVSTNPVRNLFSPSDALPEMKAALAENKAFYEVYAEDMKELFSKDLIGTKIRKEMESARVSRKQSEQLTATSAPLGGRSPGAKYDVDTSLLSSEKIGKASKQVTDYERLTKAIKEKIGAQELELTSEGKVTDGEKERMKFLIGLRDNTIKMTDAEKVATISRLNSLISFEKELALKKEIEKHDLIVLNRQADAIDAQQKEAQGVLDGTASLREQTAELGLTAEELLRLKESRIDDQISLDQWRLSLIGGTDAIGAEADAIRETIGALQDRKAAMAENTYKSIAVSSAKKAADEWQKTSDKVGDSITDALMRGFESGKGFAQTLKETVVNMFKTMILQPTIKAVVAGGLTAAGMGSAMASEGSESAFGGSSTGGMGNILSMGNSAANAYTGGTGGLYGAFATSSAGTALGLSTATSAGTAMSAYSAGGSILAGNAVGGTLSTLGATIGAAIPWIGVALAIYAMVSKDRGGPKTEGNAYGTIGADGSTSILHSAEFAAPYGDGDWGRPGGDAGTIEKMLSPVGLGISDYVKKLGGNATGLGISLGYNTDPQGKAPDNVAAGVYDASGKSVYSAIYNVDKGKASEAMGLELQKISLAAVKAASGIKPLFKEIVDGVDLTTATAAQLTQALSDVQSAVALRDAFKDLNLDAEALTVSLIKSAGGISTLGANLSDYYQSYFTEDERNQKTSAKLKTVFSGLNRDVPDSLASFRKVVEGLDLTTDSGTATFTALMNVQASFASVTNAATAAAKASADAAKAASDEALAKAKAAAEAVASERTGLQDQLDELTMTSVQLLAKQRTALDESNRALFDQINALEAQKAAIEAAIEAATSTAESGYSATSALANAAADAAETAVTSALAGVQTAIDAEKTRINTSFSTDSEALNTRIGALKALDSQLKSAINSGYTPSQAGYAMAQNGLDLAAQNMQGGVLPDSAALSQLIDRSKPNANWFASEADMMRSQARTTSALSSLSNSTAGQMSIAEQNLVAITSQRDATIKALDAQMAAASAQVDALHGIDKKTLSIGDSMDVLNDTSRKLKEAWEDQAKVGEARKQLNELQGINAGVTTLANAFQSLNESIYALAKASGQAAAVPVSNYAGSNGASYTAAKDTWSSSAGSATTPDIKATLTDIYAKSGATGVYNAATSVGLSLPDIDRITGMTAGAAFANTQANILADLTAANAKYGDQGIYDRAKALGLTLAQVDTVAGFAPGTAAQWAKDHKLPTFAIGTNYVPEDMTANIHQGERIIPAADNRELIARMGTNKGQDQTLLLAELKELRKAGDANSERINKALSDIATLLDKVMPSRDAIQVRAVA